jgi:chitin disaccharide deacetylase
MASSPPSSPPQAAPRLLGVCSIGFGIDAEGSERILALARAQRLSAVACHSAAPHWPQQARLLKRLPKSVQAGFAFQATDGEPLSAELRRVWPRFPSRERLLIDAMLKRLPLEALRTEWRTQWLAFTGYAGRAPQFISSVGLVHGLAGLRELALSAIRAEAPAPWVLHSGRVLGPGAALQRRLLEDTGGRMLLKQLQALKWPHPPALLGVGDAPADAQ